MKSMAESGQVISTEQMMDALPLLMGNACGAVSDIKSAADILKQMVDQAVRIIGSINSRIVYKPAQIRSKL